MRTRRCVPMILLCLLLCSCGGERGTSEAEVAREDYRAMSGCTMTAQVTCGAESPYAFSFTLRCNYVPEGACTVEVLKPESVKGVRATVDGKTLALEYGDLCLNVGTFSVEKLSPVDLLPRLMGALRDGWLVEENRENYGDIPALRLTLDQTGTAGGKILSTLWLRQEDDTPLCGEVSVDGEIILQAEFTDFQFGAILDEQDKGD